MAIAMDGMIIDKCGFGTFYQKKSDGSLQPIAQAGVVVDGAFAPAALTMGFTGQPKGYRYVQLDKLIKGGIYTVTGKAAPVDAQVCVSVVTGDRQEDLLAALSAKDPIASTTPAEDGSFSFVNLSYDDEGHFVVWIECEPNFTVISSASLSAQATRTNALEGTPQTLQVDIMGGYECATCKGTGLGSCSIHPTSTERKFCERCNGTGLINNEVCPDCGGVGAVCNKCYQEGKTGTFDATCNSCNGEGQLPYKYWAGTISGQCPADTGMVYFSSGYSAGRALSELEAAILASSVPTADANGNKTYSISIDKPTASYTIWCISETPNVLTASLEGTYRTQENATCLSGDTLITLFDGSFRRLDELQVGDILLAGSGEPTLVSKVGRGLWRPYHILYRFADGTVIDEISTHRFYNAEQGFWQKLEQWNIGEHAQRQDGSLVQLIQIERVDEEAECFGLWTESGDYFANGLLSGDASCNQPLLDDATFEQAMDMAMSLSELELEQMFYGGVL